MSARDNVCRAIRSARILMGREGEEKEVAFTVDHKGGGAQYPMDRRSI